MKQNLKKFVTKTSMKLKLEEIINASPALQTLSNTKLPVLVSFKLSMLLKELNPVYQSYNESRTKLLEKYGKLNKEKTNYDFDGNKREEYAEKHKELLQADIKLDIPDIKISELDDIKIEPIFLEQLNWLLK
jgi:hypothetical protein